MIFRPLASSMEAEQVADDSWERKGWTLTRLSTAGESARGAQGFSTGVKLQTLTPAVPGIHLRQLEVVQEGRRVAQPRACS